MSRHLRFERSPVPARSKRDETNAEMAALWTARYSDLAKFLAGFDAPIRIESASWTEGRASIETPKGDVPIIFSRISARLGGNAILFRPPTESGIERAENDVFLGALQRRLFNMGARRRDAAA